MRVCGPHGVHVALLRNAALWLALASATSALQAQRPVPINPRTSSTPTAQCASTVPGEGLWQLSLWPEGSPETAPSSTGALLLEPHPDYPGSVRGSLKRSTHGNGAQAWVSGDLIHGEFNLDESVDGKNISAVWTGVAAGQGCAMAIRGERWVAERTSRDANAINDTNVWHFSLKKAPAAASPATREGGRAGTKQR